MAFMKLFSQRNGFVKARDIIQKESMDADLKIGLWNVLCIFVWGSFKNPFLYNDTSFDSFIKQIWMYFFKYPLDTLDPYWDTTYPKIKQKYLNFEWYQVYDFLEFILNNYPRDTSQAFIDACNLVLEKERSAYRFVGNVITEITSEVEIKEIDEVIHKSPNNVQKHLTTALKLLSDKKKPDYRNSIKESISAVESICIQISGDENATLGKALTQIEENGKVKLHRALKGSFSKLYGYTSATDGIRHALLEDDNLDFEDAKFMLVSCSSFTNYLIIKSNKAGIKLK